MTNPDSPLQLTVIAPVYNHWHLVPTLVAALAEQSLPPDAFELILVDNGSDEVPADPALPPWARLLHCATPGSYAARNTALQAARGRWLAFTDADCRPTPQWLSSALAVLSAQASDDLLLAGGVRVEPEDWSHMTAAELYDLALGLPQARYVRNGYAITANLFIPRAAFDRVGPFDATRFSGGDAEFCRRAVAAGCRLTFCAEAEVMHPARRTWEELVTKRKRVKGGQIRGGSFYRRLMFAVRTFLPPVFAWSFAMRTKRLSLAQRLHVCWLLVRLWGIDIAEFFRLMFGGTPVRR